MAHGAAAGLTLRTQDEWKQFLIENGGIAEENAAAYATKFIANRLNENSLPVSNL